MRESQLSSLPPEEKKRLAYIEGREDLFETKVLEIDTGAETPPEHKILVITRDPGSANALAPVMEVLQKDPSMGMVALTDGRAQDILKNKFKTSDVTPQDTALASYAAIGQPDVVLIDVSSSEAGLDTYSASTFNEVPSVILEDYYGTAGKLMGKYRQRGIPLPEKICVMDADAKAITLRDFPEMEDRIEITGQPAFDKFAREDTEKIAAEVKNRLGLKLGEKLVSLMGAIDPREATQAIVDHIKQLGAEFYLAFRRHPRDNMSAAEYEEMFRQAGLKTLNTDQFTTDEIGAASDVVLTTTSTEGLNGVYRRKPTIHVTDLRYDSLPSGVTLPLPPVKLGASIGIENVGSLTGSLQQLLDPRSETNSRLSENMEKFYPKDGKNAERVAAVVAKIARKEN